MPRNTVKIQKLSSYKELTTEDQRICRIYYKQKMNEHNLRNKYLKRTNEIYQKTAGLPVNATDCFMSFDEAYIGEHFKVLIVLINGITIRYNYVLYFCVIDLRRIDSETLPHFYCDVLINLLCYEMTRLPHLTLKFVLCRNTYVCAKTLRIMRKSPDTKDIFKRFKFIIDPLELKSIFSFNKYAQTAINDILYGTLSWENFNDIFEKHRLKLHDKPELMTLMDFITDFERLSDDLLSYRNEITLCNCTLRFLDLLFYSLRVHMKDVDWEDVCRTLIFSYSALKSLLCSVMKPVNCLTLNLAELSRRCAQKIE